MDDYEYGEVATIDVEWDDPNSVDISDIVRV